MLENTVRKKKNSLVMKFGVVFIAVQCSAVWWNKVFEQKLPHKEHIPGPLWRCWWRSRRSGRSGGEGTVGLWVLGASKTHKNTPEQNFLEYAQNLNFWTQNLKIRRFFIFWQNLTKFIQIICDFIAILDHNSAENFIKLNSTRAKLFTFRRSACRV